MNRIDRISAILIHLQTKKFVTAEEIAKRFETSKRTIYRDLKTLDEAGVPIGAEPGKGYFIVDGYHLPPVMFTGEEASAMLTAEKLIEKMADQSVNSNYKSAMYKIKSVLPDREKQFLDKLDENIEILYNRPLQLAEIPTEGILSIQQALVQKKVINIDYRAGYSQELIANRLVEPVGLCFYSMAWHLIGFCRYRNDYRDFRVDRIVKLHVTDEVFKPGKIKTVREFFEFSSEKFELEKVVLRFPKSASTLVNNTRYFYGFTGEEDCGDFVEMTFVTNDMTYFSRWLLMYIDIIEVVSPPKLMEILKGFVVSIKNRFP